MRVIGLRGQRGHGKDFLASAIKGYCENDVGISVEIMGFADRLKRAAADIFGYPYDWTLTQEGKERDSGWRWQELCAALQAKYPNKAGMISVGETLQLLGTDVCRDHLSNSVWISGAIKAAGIAGAELVIFKDTRFPNEVETVKSLGGSVWLVDGSGRPQDAARTGHSSESALDGITPDAVILNHPGTTIEQLEAQFAPLIAKEFAHA